MRPAGTFFIIQLSNSREVIHNHPFYVYVNKPNADSVFM